MALALELGDDDLVDVEEAVLLEADLDERGLHPRQDVVDDALVDVAGDRASAGPLEVDLDNLVILEHGHALLADVDRDQHLLSQGRQRRPASVSRPSSGASARRPSRQPALPPWPFAPPAPWRARRLASVLSRWRPSPAPGARAWASRVAPHPRRSPPHRSSCVRSRHVSHGGAAWPARQSSRAPAAPPSPPALLSPALLLPARPGPAPSRLPAPPGAACGETTMPQIPPAWPRPEKETVARRAFPGCMALVVIG